MYQEAAINTENIIPDLTSAYFTRHGSEGTKNSRILWGCSVMHVGSGGLLRAWENFDFEHPRLLQIPILATKTAAKHQCKSFVTLESPRKLLLLKLLLLQLIYIDGKTHCSLRLMHKWTHSVFPFLFDVSGCMPLHKLEICHQASQYACKRQTQGDITFLMQKHEKYRKR